MKYFENLPKKNFNSTIGTFSISDFFTYLDPNLQKIDTSPVTVDTKTTLLEEAYTIYGDLNSFWMFVSANKTVNPFTLLSPNVTIYLTENEAKTSLELTDNIVGTTSYTFPKGSIILPYINNSGGSYSYSSVGNFDLNGPLSIVESVSYFNDTMIIKDQKGATYSFISQSGTTGSQIVIVYPTPGGTYGIQKQLYPYNTKSATKQTVTVEYSVEGVIEEFGDPVSPYKSKSKSTPSSFTSTTTGVTGTQITAVEALTLQTKNIAAYLPSQTGILKGLFVTTKYN